MKIKQALWLVTVFCTSISIAQANNCSKENWAPDSRYTIKNDIVLDNETGLEWKRCPEGLNWNGSACTGVPLQISWNDAIKKYASLGRDWRLPTHEELATLRTRGTSDPQDLQRSSCNIPAINQLVFPGSAATGVFWSSTKKYDDTAWFVMFTEGLLFSYHKKAAGYIRLVRSIGQAEYIDNNDGTVSDKRTNLTWARCSVGQTWDGQTCSGTATEFYSYDLISVINSANGIVTGTREVGKPFWRLPTVDELETLILCPKGYEYKELPSGKYVAQQSCFKEYSQPRIDLTAFPNTPKVGSDYWTSSVDSADSEKIGIVGFGSGLTFYQKSRSDNYVRLVLDKSTSVYEVNADGTVYDKATNLTWMRCSLGQSWDGKTCTGEAKKYTWYDATKLTHQFAGSTAWRLPTVEELDSLVYCSKGRKPSARPNREYVEDTNGACLGDNYQEPTINISAFPNTSDDSYWSSSPYASNSDGAWNVYFYSGYVSPIYKNKNYYHVRLVRAGSNPSTPKPALSSSEQKEPPETVNKYVVNPNGTVYDKETNLTWMRCSLGQSWDGKTCTGEVKKYTWYDATKLTHQFAGSTAWRLPTFDELDSLVYCSNGRKPSERREGKDVEDTNGVCLGENHQKPTIDISAFPNTSAYSYWSSSPYAGNSSRAWYVSFGNGYVNDYYKDFYRPIRLVRAGSNPSTPKPALSSSEQKEPPVTVNKYVVNPNGTVYDKETNLTWMRCSLGQSWDGKTCTGEVKKYTWYDATKLTHQFAGSTAWRLPTFDELDSLVYCSNGRKHSERPEGKDVEDTNGVCLGENHQKPTIDISAFPNTSAYAYWSSSPYAGNSSRAWYVSFGNGYVNDYYKDFYRPIRLVRAGSNPSTPKPALSSTEQKEPPATVDKYVVNPNGTVYDKETNLTWMRCSLGQSWDGKTCTGEAKEYTWRDAIKLKHNFAGSTAWRLPTIDELDSLVDCWNGRKPSVRPNGKYVHDTNGGCIPGKRERPTIDISAFPNTPTSLWYWSSSPYAYDSHFAWHVYFFSGLVSYNQDKRSNGHVRLVRAGQ